jgi:hypothetical protein
MKQHRPLLFPRAGNGTRTRDPNLGKVVLYQLSYSREEAGVRNVTVTPNPLCSTHRRPSKGPIYGDGGEGNRTPDLLNAIQALSQLSYAPGLRLALLPVGKFRNDERRFTHRVGRLPTGTREAIHG